MGLGPLYRGKGSTGFRALRWEGAAGKGALFDSPTALGRQGFSLGTSVSYSESARFVSGAAR